MDSSTSPGNRVDYVSSPLPIGFNFKNRPYISSVDSLQTSSISRHSYREDSLSKGEFEGSVFPDVVLLAGIGLAYLANYLLKKERIFSKKLDGLDSVL